MERLTKIKDLLKQMKEVMLVVAVVDTNSNYLPLLVVGKPEEYSVINKDSCY